jgi:3-oxoacyl-[acyl-carrier protein] reductase
VTDTRVALVTGASRGIGRAIADGLLEAGHCVIGTATTSAGVDQLAGHLGERGLAVRLMLDEPSSVEEAFAAMAEGPGMPLILVNNAGITRDNLMLRMSEADWTGVIDTNVNGLYRVTRPALRAMVKARWGRIVNVSSVVARLGNAGQTNYVASKAAIEGFTRALAIELASRNVTVNALAPGFVETDMTGELDERQATAMLERIPLGRMARPAEIAAAAVFLASDAAGYITGETLHVNGGLGMF